MTMGEHPRLHTAEELLAMTKPVTWIQDVLPLDYTVKRSEFEQFEGFVKAVPDYLTAFTVALDANLKAYVFLDNRKVPVQRKATEHDFDVAALWVAKYKAK